MPNPIRSAHLPVLAAALLSALAAPAHATDVIGNLNVDTRWTAAGSPYRLTGDVTVAPQATLTIEPGVIVEAAASDTLGAGTSTQKVELIVRGALVADGSAASPITMRGATAGAGKWYGLSFEPGARASSLTNASVADAEIGIWSRTSAALQLADLLVTRNNTGIQWQASPGPTLTRVTVDGAGTSGIRIEDDGASGANALLTACTVRNAAQQGLLVWPRVNATVRRSQFYRNDIGAQVFEGAQVTFQNNLVFGNTSKGLVLKQNGTNAFNIVNNTIDRNIAQWFNTASAGTGIHVEAVSQASTFIIRNNIVTTHGTAGIRADGQTLPSLDHNDVWGNAANYQGTGLTAGTGSISTNPLYVQSFDASGTWISVNQAYVWNDTGTLNFNQILQQPGAMKMRVRFGSSTTYALGHDEVWVFDAAGTRLNTYGGSFSGLSAAANGDSIRVQYYDDGGGHSGTTVRVDGYDWQATVFNYRLQQTSPVIDIGNDLGAPTEDADGATRPYDGDVNGTSTTDMGAFEWHENIPPLAVAGPDRIVLPNTQVAFSSAGSRDPDGSIGAYDWDFGDGSAHAATADATHSYAATGTFTVKLTVTDDKAVVGFDTAVITVANNLPPVAEAGPDRFVDVGQQVSLDGGGSSDPDGTVVGYAWNFGDGSPAGSGVTVTHSYPRSGVFTITLTVTDNRGATASDTASAVVGGTTANSPPRADAGLPKSVTLGQSVTLDGSASLDEDGTIASYAWAFGDGANGTGATVQHTYAAAGQFTVTLTVTDDDNATDSDTTVVTVAVPPNAAPNAAAGGPYSVQVGSALGFDGSASTDSDGTVASYAWDFGDGNFGTGATPAHTYLAAGTYLVRLTVTDDRGAGDEDTALVTVRSRGNQAPVANAGPDQSAVAGANVVFDGRASADADGTLAAYAWEFGDGTDAAGAQAQHAYAAAGNYLVRLTVTDNAGAEDSDFALVTVTPVATGGNVAPVAAAGADLAANAGAALAFNGSGSSDSDGNIIAYQWDFGDGGTAAGLSATHVYGAGGAFTVTLTVIDDDGARATDTLVATLNALPVADAGSARTAKAGETLTFDAGGSEDADGTIVSYAWDFGDGARGEGESATHAYVSEGAYTVKLTVTDDKGARGTASISVLVATALVTPPRGGCGCNAGASGSGAGVPLLLLALGFAATRRRAQ